MIIDWQQPVNDGGIIVFPPTTAFGTQPKQTADIIETIQLTGTNAAPGGITGTVDE